MPPKLRCEVNPIEHVRGGGRGGSKRWIRFQCQDSLMSLPKLALGSCHGGSVEGRVDGESNIILKSRTTEVLSEGVQ